MQRGGVGWTGGDFYTYFFHFPPPFFPSPFLFLSFSHSVSFSLILSLSLILSPSPLSHSFSLWLFLSLVLFLSISLPPFSFSLLSLSFSLFLSLFSCFFLLTFDIDSDHWCFRGQFMFFGKHTLNLLNKYFFQQEVVKKTDLSERQVDRWLRRRGKLDTPSTMQKFTECRYMYIIIDKNLSIESLACFLQEMNPNFGRTGKKKSSMGVKVDSISYSSHGNNRKWILSKNGKGGGMWGYL